MLSWTLAPTVAGVAGPNWEDGEHPNSRVPLLKRLGSQPLLVRSLIRAPQRGAQRGECDAAFHLQMGSPPNRCKREPSWTVWLQSCMWQPTKVLDYLPHWFLVIIPFSIISWWFRSGSCSFFGWVQSLLTTSYNHQSTAVAIRHCDEFDCWDPALAEPRECSSAVHDSIPKKSRLSFQPIIPNLWVTMLFWTWTNKFQFSNVCVENQI